MTQKYDKVVWQDETTSQQGTLINAERLDQMQTAHHYADGFEEVDEVPTEDPGVDYHKVVYCTADTTFYRWNGEEWTKDVDDDTKALLLAHEADHANPHVVTKAQVGLGNCDNTSDLDKPVSTATQTALNGKVTANEAITGATKTKITYDSKGLVTAGTDLEASDIPDIGISQVTGLQTALDAKMDDTQIKSSWSSPVSNDNIPSEKLVKDTLDTKADKATTLAGYGITDAVDLNTAQTLPSGANKKFTNTAATTASSASVKGVIELTNIDMASAFPGNRYIFKDALVDGNGAIVHATRVQTTSTQDLIISYITTKANGTTKTPKEIMRYNRSTDTWTDTMVQNDLDAYLPMVRTSGNQEVMGQKTIEDLIIGKTFDNKSTVTLFDADTSKYCRMYTYNNSTGAQYKTFMVMITPKRLNINRTGLLYFGDNRNTTPTIGWLLKGSDIANTDFVITKEADGTISLWCKTYTGASDGYHGIRILEHTTSNLAAGYLEAVINEEGYTITPTGYTDRDGIVHTFTSYITPS